VKRKYKARVYSILVFPGAGHFVLRRWWRGCLFMVPALWGLVVVVNLIMERAMNVFDQLLSGKLEPDYAAIYQAIHEQSAGNTLVYNTAILLLLATWLLATVDVWILGRDDQPD